MSGKTKTTEAADDLPGELGWWARHSVNDDLTPVLERAATEIVRLRAENAILRRQVEAEAEFWNRHGPGADYAA